MCGIFSYVGKKDVVKEVVAGLKRLEYRGYDSVGFSSIVNNEIFVNKKLGKISDLEEFLDISIVSDVIIGHTRWATHGKPSVINAHPHLSNNRKIAVVHNGIIENYEDLKNNLIKKNYFFRSDTDTEVLAVLIEDLYNGNLVETMTKVLDICKGSLAFTCIHIDFPEDIIAVKKESPLLIGINNDEHYISSDLNSFLLYTNKVYCLEDNEIAVVSKNNIDFFNKDGTKIKKDIEVVNNSYEGYEKNDFEYYMLKEIYEQPKIIKNVIKDRILYEEGNTFFDELKITDDELKNINNITFLACGSSRHASMLVAEAIESWIKIPCKVEVASEYICKDPIISDRTLFIFVSQSGETADTLSSLKKIKKYDLKKVAFCNSSTSTLYREVSSCIDLRAGMEVGVAATKSFTSQVVTMLLFALKFSRVHGLSINDGKKILDNILLLSDSINDVLSKQENIMFIAKKYLSKKKCFFAGRGPMYPIALESSLKFKEITYKMADGIPFGEMKHGPISLIDEDAIVIALCPNELFHKSMNNILEVKSRNGNVFVIGCGFIKGIDKIVDNFILLPDMPDIFVGIVFNVVTQLFAYFTAKYLGNDIDRPRNLAKSVTVE